MFKLLLIGFFIFCLVTQFRLVINFFLFIIGVFVVTYNKIFGGQTVFYHGVKQPRKMKNFHRTKYNDPNVVIDNEEVKFTKGKYTVN